MYITYEDLSKIFPTAIGIKGQQFDFHTVSISASEHQPKGLFIPLLPTSGDLQTAMKNGAIAALWKKGSEVPKYTPNHFPIFFVDELVMGIKEIVLQNKKSLTFGNNVKKDKTNFLFLDEKLLKVLYESYDNAVIEAKIAQMLEGIREEKE